MSVKASVSLTESQDTFARELVERGRFSSLSAVVQSGLELLREKHQLKEAELAALKKLLDERRSGEFVEGDEASARTKSMIERKRAERGL